MFIDITIAFNNVIFSFELIVQVLYLVLAVLDLRKLKPII